jgi:hypothetical protein
MRHCHYYTLLRRLRYRINIFSYTRRIAARRLGCPRHCLTSKLIFSTELDHSIGECLSPTIEPCMLIGP